MITWTPPEIHATPVFISGEITPDSIPVLTEIPDSITHILRDTRGDSLPEGFVFPDDLDALELLSLTEIGEE